MAHDFESFVKTSIVLAIDALTVFICDIKQLLRVIVNLTGTVNFKLDTNK